MRKRYLALLAPIMALIFVTTGNVSVAQATATVVHEEIVQTEFIQESQTLSVSPAAVVPEASRDGYGVTVYDVVGWPVISTGYSDGFGFRSCSGCSSDHQGIDFTPGGGTPVMAVAKGVVVQAGYLGSLGNAVTIAHTINGQQVTTVYGHMMDGSLAVQEGDSVAVGQQIGLVGSTGFSTGNHLHFEVRYNGIAVDPLPWLYEHVNVDAWDWLTQS